MAKEAPLTLDEEQAKKKGYGGTSAADIEAAVTAFQDQKSKAAKLAADLGDKLKKYEDKGGNKKAIKVAAAINAMDITNAFDFWQHLEAALDVLGFFDQMDMFASKREQELNSASVAAAETKAAKAPKTGAETAIN